MKSLRTLALLPLCILALVFVMPGQQGGPKGTGSETVARPRKGSTPPAEAEQPKIPSKFGKQNKEGGDSIPTFSTDAVTVSVDVAVVDNRRDFVPEIPRGDFPAFQHDVPPEAAGYSMRELPMAVD